MVMSVSDRANIKTTQVTNTERTAIAIALDELDCYIGVMGEDSEEMEREANLGRLRWASKKLTAAELANAIPPAYTELIGHQLMQHVEGRRAGSLSTGWAATRCGAL